ncbi:MAG: ClbS/DfsB family four-helix bundle protein [Chloroflexota bacterium]
MNKQELLNEITQSREAMLAALDGLPDDAYLRPGVVGLWSVKDVLAHLTVWYSELITALSQLDRPGAPNIVEIEDIDEFNEEQYRLNTRRSLAVILEDFRGVYKILMKTVEEIDEKTFNNVRRFSWMEGEPLWYLIAENAYWHEKEHAEEIRKWRDTEGI